MRKTSIKVKELMVHNFSERDKWVEITTLLLSNNTNQNVVVKTTLELPQDMTLNFFKNLRKTQKKPVNQFNDDPTAFIQVINIENYDNIEKKVMNFFRTIWHNLQQANSPRFRGSKQKQIEEVRNLRLRL